ncbi:MAG TPA: winged helix-turn-helix domain-containing protein [Rhodanobacteraceae bacterium]|nr:winged helix-turn-helix domain-containing protein [Rhodanobacteraceae bacterium]
MIRRIYRFGHYSVDPATRELRADGELVALSPTLFDCLAWLIEHRDRAVGRDELVAAVWGKSEIADTQLVQAILKARRAVGDTGEEQRAIRTIPRFGYRWVAATDVEPCETDAPAAASAEIAPPAIASRSAARRSPVVRMAAATIAIAAIGVAAWTMLAHRPDTAATAPAGVSAAAVLPADVTADHDWRWLRLGLMDLVADRLREAGLSVVPSDNVVSLVRDAGEGDAALRAVRDAIAPRWTVRPAARRGTAGWTVSLDLRDADRHLVVEASAADPAAAAREAAARLLPLLGRADPRGGAPVGDDDLAPRIRAAILADDYETASRWLAGATAEQSGSNEIRVLQGQADFGLGRFEIARSHFTALLADLGESADPILRARALKGRGASAIRLADAPAAERDFSEMLDLVPAGDTSSLVGDALSGRGVARAMQGRHDEAMADFARARIALQLVGDTLGLAGVEMNEGALNAQRGHPAESLASFRSAAQHFEKFGAHSDLAIALVNEIEANLKLLEPARALEVAGRAELLAAKLEDSSASRLVAYWRASALAAVGRLAEANEQLDQLIRSSAARDDTGVLAMSRHRKGVLALAAGRIEDAVALAGQVVAGTEGSPWNDVRAEAWLTLIRGLRGQGRDADAAREVERFAAWAEDNSDHPVQILAKLARAEQAWGEHHRDAAAAAYGEALTLAERSAVPADIATVGVSWGTTLIAEGELEAAGPVVGRVARWAESDFACAVLQANLYRALGQSAAWEAALAQARALAGERAVPSSASAAPGQAPLISSR